MKNKDGIMKKEAVSNMKKDTLTNLEKLEGGEKDGKKVPMWKTNIPKR